MDYFSGDKNNYFIVVVVHSSLPIYVMVISKNSSQGSRQITAVCPFPALSIPIANNTQVRLEGIKEAKGILEGENKLAINEQICVVELWLQ